jgi:hypothetical protein
MSKPRTLRCYDYVPIPYATVREALRADTLAIFQGATQSAAARADELNASLRAGLGPFDVGVDAKIRIRGVTDEVSPLGDMSTRIELAWTAARRAGLFPAMDAVLTVYPLSATETQLDLDGQYRPPMGAVGSALDALVGHRLAEAAVLRFLRDIAVYLTSLVHPGRGDPAPAAAA